MSLPAFAHWPFTKTPPSPSELLATLTLKDGRIASLMVGGRAQVSATRTIELAD